MASMPTTDETAELAGRLRLAVTRLARQLRQTSSSDLSPTQSAVLATLANHGPVTLGELAELERVASPTITKVTGILQERGLVEKVPDPHDRRFVRVELTAEGRALVERSRANAETLIDTEQGLLNPLGVNAIRRFPIYQTVAFGSRTVDGADALVIRLAELDPVAASKIEPGNVRRTVRALEVAQASLQSGGSVGGVELRILDDNGEPLLTGKTDIVLQMHYTTNGEAAVDAMRRLGGPTGATLFMAVLAVFQAVLARHAGQDDVAVGGAGAGYGLSRAKGEPGLEAAVPNPFDLLLGTAGAVAVGSIAGATAAAATPSRKSSA